MQVGGGGEQDDVVDILPAFGSQDIKRRNGTVVQVSPRSASA